MKWVVMVALGATLAGCGAARHSGVEGVGTRFNVSSFGSGYGIVTRFEGTITVNDRWVYLVAPVGAVRTHQLDRQDYWDLRLRAALVSCKTRDFEVVSEGRATRLLPLLGLSQDAATLDTTLRVLRDTLRLDVGVPSGTDLARSWIALVLEWPFQSVMATYTVHTNVPLSGSPWVGRQEQIPGERCR